MPGPINNYLNALARRLHLDPQNEREILEELQAHIEDKAAELEAQGLDRETALNCAVEEMGAPRTLASRMYAVHSTGVWRDVALAMLPHFLLAALFALHLWSHYFLVSVGPGRHCLRDLAQLAGRAPQQVVVLLDGLHPGCSGHFLAACR